MKTITTLLLAFLFSVSCNTITREEKSDTGNIAAKTKIEFEHTKWHEKKDRDYPYRDPMLDDLMNSKKLKELKHREVLDLLGPPDRTDSLYLFYMVAQKRIHGWPVYTKTLVTKLAEDSEKLPRIDKFGKRPVHVSIKLYFYEHGIFRG